MNSLSNWLNKHEYEFLNDVLFKDKILRLRDKANSSKKLLKVMSLSELDPKVVVEVVNRMNQINDLNIAGLMKYKVIEKDENCLYRIMEEYKTHLDEIKPIKYFEDIDIFFTLNGILIVLKSLNENGFIHSDLKPSNIFLNDENEIIMSDCCNNLLYKGREEMKQVRIVKDLCFVCIDELLGKEIDISSDIWNFGLIFYYLKSGKYPFVGSNMLKTLENIRDLKYIPLECECDVELNSFLCKILRKEKKDRLKLNEIIIELKKLNKPELTVIPFAEEEEINIDEELKNKINSIIDRCIKENGYELNFRGLYMEDSGMKYLCSRLNTMNNVIYIDIESHKLSSVGLNTFSKCLKFFPNLEKLESDGNPVTNPIVNDGLKIFSENLHFIPKLKRLGLYGYGLGEKNMKFLSSHFKDIPNLEELAIPGDNGVRYLCENINEMPKLEELCLNDNEISDIGGKILLDNLPKCKELVYLLTFNNKISNYYDFQRRMTEKHPNKSLIIG